MVKSASSALSDVREPDFIRYKSYTHALNQYIDEVMKKPMIDSPKANPRDYDMGDAETFTLPDNEAVMDLVRMWDNIEAEVTYSNSSMQPSCLIVHDEKRLRDALERMDMFLDDYVSTVLPLDLPESMPLRASTGQGRGSAAGGQK